jgi:hypothetical protein
VARAGRHALRNPQKDLRGLSLLVRMWTRFRSGRRWGFCWWWRSILVRLLVSGIAAWRRHVLRKRALAGRRRPIAGRRRRAGRSPITQWPTPAAFWTKVVAGWACGRRSHGRHSRDSVPGGVWKLHCRFPVRRQGEKPNARKQKYNETGYAKTSQKTGQKRPPPRRRHSATLRNCLAP